MDVGTPPRACALHNVFEFYLLYLLRETTISQLCVNDHNMLRTWPTQRLPLTVTARLDLDEMMLLEPE